MQSMSSSEIRQRFLAFFAKRGHAIIPSASLVPQNDPSVLFNTAGMQPLASYLLGEKHPLGNRLASVQKCVRTGDLEDIGDNRHLSFFEMMGNWSLGDYFKREAITWSYEFLTSKEEGLGLDPNRLYVTVFEGDENAPEDTESPEIWQSLGIPENRIYKLGADDNWWSPGDNGPCGPDTEMFYDLTDNGIGNLSKEEFLDAVKREDLVEIWNDVFMEYEKKDGKVIGKLSQKNVDTGAGLERITAVMQGKKTAYDTDLFAPLMSKIDSLSSSDDFKSKRVIADHIRTSIFMIADGVIPGNTARGYVLRRLIRRAILKAKIIKLEINNPNDLVPIVIEIYKEAYPELLQQKDHITEVFRSEGRKFIETIHSGDKELTLLFIKARDNNFPITGANLFHIYSTYGFPVELSIETLESLGVQNLVGRGLYNKREVLAEFKSEFKEHQDLSRTASAGMFKGGLANHSEKTIKLHTAHHLLLAALQQVLGKEVKQRGSNITEERLRLDFAFDRKMTDEEKKKVEDLVNGWIEQKLNVVRREMPLAEAEKIGAEMEFGAKYPETVSVYFIEGGNGGIEDAISKEFCGGPHVTNTGELGHFTLQKEEASSQGVRRIKGVLS